MYLATKLAFSAKQFVLCTCTFFIYSTAT